MNDLTMNRILTTFLDIQWQDQSNAKCFAQQELKNKLIFCDVKKEFEIISRIKAVNTDNDNYFLRN